MTVCFHCMENSSSGILLNLFVFYNRKSHVAFFLTKLKKRIYTFRWTIPLSTWEPLTLCRKPGKKYAIPSELFFLAIKAKIRSISKGVYGPGETDINVGSLISGHMFLSQSAWSALEHRWKNLHFMPHWNEHLNCPQKACARGDANKVKTEMRAEMNFWEHSEMV